MWCTLDHVTLGYPRQRNPQTPPSGESFPTALPEHSRPAACAPKYSSFRPGPAELRGIVVEVYQTEGFADQSMYFRGSNEKPHGTKSSYQRTSQPDFWWKFSSKPDHRVDGFRPEVLKADGQWDSGCKVQMVDYGPFIKS